MRMTKREARLLAGDKTLLDHEKGYPIKGGIAVSGTFKLLFPFPAIATWNKTAALESAKKLQNFSPGLLAVGHGKMIKQPMDQINKAIQEAEKKITKKHI